MIAGGEGRSGTDARTVALRSRVLAAGGPPWAPPREEFVIHSRIKVRKNRREAQMARVRIMLRELFFGLSRDLNEENVRFLSVVADDPDGGKTA